MLTVSDLRKSCTGELTEHKQRHGQRGLFGAATALRGTRACTGLARGFANGEAPSGSVTQAQAHDVAVRKVAGNFRGT